MPHETWSTRDEPVLEAIVELLDDGARVVNSPELAERTGLDVEDVRRAIIALAHEAPPFFAYTDFSALNGPNDLGSIRNVTGHARRTVGAWPTPEMLADRLIAGMEQAANETDNEEEASRLRRTGQWFGAAGRDVLVSIMSTAMTGG
jgi:hypothetical protein